MANEIARNSQDGTGAVIDIRLGFVPDYVKVVNIESPTMEQLEYYRGMPAASARKGVVGGNATKITTNGITLLTGGPLPDGFRIGADVDVNVLGETLVWEAHRGGW
jgi:hypothetical protein